MTRYDRVAADATTYEDLMTGFLAALAQTMRDEAHMHRIWYDIRSQTLFETAFRADVAELDKSLEDMIWRIMCQFAELTGETQLCRPGDLCDDRRAVSAVPPQALSGDPHAIDQMQADVRLVISKITSSSAPP